MAGVRATGAEAFQSSTPGTPVPVTPSFGISCHQLREPSAVAFWEVFLPLGTSANALIVGESGRLGKRMGVFGI